MHGHHDSDHYDVQFTTRQLVMLFGLLIVIVVGVFVGGIVIGRGMAPDAAEAMMARRTSPVPAPPPAKAAPASVADAPEEDTLRLPIRSEPKPAAEHRGPYGPAPAEHLCGISRPGRPAPRLRLRHERLRHRGLRPARPPRVRSSSRTGLSRFPDRAPPRTRRRRRAADRPKPAAAGKFTIQVAAFRDRAAAERMLEQLADARNRGIPGGHSGRDLPGARRTVRDPGGRPRALAARLESEQFATLVTSR